MRCVGSKALAGDSTQANPTATAVLASEEPLEQELPAAVLFSCSLVFPPGPAARAQNHYSTRASHITVCRC